MWTSRMWSNCFVCDSYESRWFKHQTQHFLLLGHVRQRFLRCECLNLCEYVFLTTAVCDCSLTPTHHLSSSRKHSVHHLESWRARPQLKGRTDSKGIVIFQWRCVCEQWSLDVSHYERLFETRPTATSSDVVKCPPQQLGSTEKQIGTVRQGFLIHHSSQSWRAGWGLTVRDVNWACWPVPASPPAAQELSDCKHLLRAAQLQRH